MFAALLLMYLKELRSVLGPIRFLSSNPVWLRALGLRRVGGVEVHSVPDRTRFYRLARRIGVDGMMRILSVMVVRLMQRGVIRAKSVSLDATIISAWSKDCRSRKDEQHLKTCRHEVSKDRDASWGYDHHRDGYVCGYKVHRPHGLGDGPPHPAHRHQRRVRRDQDRAMVRLHAPAAGREVEEVLRRHGGTAATRPGSSSCRG